MVGTFSTSQFLSLIIVPLSILMLVVLGRRASRPAPDSNARRVRAA
jgi:hypothetical protein